MDTHEFEALIEKLPTTNLNIIYGDWSCTTFNSDTKKPIGEFCADAGLVGVFSLKEVLKYNPKFDYHTNRKWTTTLIKNFTGDVWFEVEPYVSDDYESGEVKEISILKQDRQDYKNKWGQVLTCPLFFFTSFH